MIFSIKKQSNRKATYIYIVFGIIVVVIFQSEFYLEIY